MKLVFIPHFYDVLVSSEKLKTLGFSHINNLYLRTIKMLISTTGMSKTRYVIPMFFVIFCYKFVKPMHVYFYSDLWSS